MRIVAAMVSAFFSGVTSVLVKLGVRTTDTDIAITLRTFVILILTWGIAAAFGDLAAWSSLNPTAVIFLATSGICSGVSWTLFFKVLSCIEGILSNLATAIPTTFVFATNALFLIACGDAHDDGVLVGFAQNCSENEETPSSETKSVTN